MSLNYKQNDELIPLYQSGVSPNQMDNTETDANDCVPIDTDIKVYRVGNSATNIPIQQAGIIETFVYRDSGNVRVTQRYTVNYNTSGTPTFSRTAIGDDNSLTWSEWSTFDNYSTDEQVVGRWIDGKPIYRKVCQHSNSQLVSQSDWTQLPSGQYPTNVARVIHCSGCGVNDTFKPLLASANGKVLSPRNGASGLSEDLYISIWEYTKNTD